MACIVYQTNKKTGVVYAYRSESYRDPETKKPTSHRTYLGRVDPITKTIIGKAEGGKRNRSKLNTIVDQSSIDNESEKRIEQLEDKIRKLQKENDELTAYKNKMGALMKRINKMTTDV